MSQALSVNVPVLLPLTLLERNTGQINDVPENPRFIRDEKYKKLVQSIVDHPNMMSLRELLVYQIGKKYVILGGNMRYRALKQLGYTHAPCKIIPQNTSIEELRATVIKDNNAFGENDWEMIANHWDKEELLKWGTDIPEMTTLEEEEAKEDDYEMPDEIKTDIVQGDMFEFKKDGKVLHRLLCGDSTKIDDVERVMGGEKAVMVFTDPPYNVASDSKNYAADVSKSMDKLSKSEWDRNFNIEDFVDILPIVIAKDCTIYIWTSHYLFERIRRSLLPMVDFDAYLVWSKPNPMPSLSKRHPTWNTELCVYGTVGTKRIVNFPNGQHFLSCRTIEKKSDGSHPTQKPIELIVPIINFNSNLGNIVFDGFLGSGSTMVASHQLNRRCYGIELDPKYCQVILDRMKKLDPELEIVKV